MPGWASRWGRGSLGHAQDDQETFDRGRRCALAFARGCGRRHAPGRRARVSSFAVVCCNAPSAAASVEKSSGGPSGPCRPEQQRTPSAGSRPPAVMLSRCRGRGVRPMRPGETIEAPNMGMRVTCRESAVTSGGELLSFDFWMRCGATPPPMHVHPHQEERITVVRGSVRSRSGAAHRVLLPGDTVVSPPGEAHTVSPAGNEDVEMVAELRPALGYEQFMERSFALDRAGHVNAKGRGNPLRTESTRRSRTSPRTSRRGRTGLRCDERRRPCGATRRCRPQ
jgi:mannose-6-phosphate isomerase-like protein (cupin superfamily)